MKLFAPNEVTVKSRFWYFLHKIHKLKKTTGEILSVNEIFEKRDTYVKNYGIFLRYNSRSGVHNMYKEYRAMTLTDAVAQCYAEMAGHHRARNRSIQIIKTTLVKAADVKRANLIQFIDSKIKFPLTHIRQRPSTKQLKTIYKANRPTTFFG